MIYDRNFCDPNKYRIISSASSEMVDCFRHLRVSAASRRFFSTSNHASMRLSSLRLIDRLSLSRVYSGNAFAPSNIWIWISSIHAKRRCLFLAAYSDTVFEPSKNMIIKCMSNGPLFVS